MDNRKRSHEIGDFRSFSVKEWSSVIRDSSFLVSVMYPTSRHNGVSPYTPTIPKVKRSRYSSCILPRVKNGFLTRGSSREYCSDLSIYHSKCGKGWLYYGFERVQISRPILTPCRLINQYYREDDKFQVINDKFYYKFILNVCKSIQCIFPKNIIILFKV